MIAEDQAQCNSNSTEMRGKDRSRSCDVGEGRGQSALRPRGSEKRCSDAATGWRVVLVSGIATLELLQHGRIMIVLSSVGGIRVW